MVGIFALQSCGAVWEGDCTRLFMTFWQEVHRHVRLQGRSTPHLHLVGHGPQAGMQSIPVEDATLYEFMIDCVDSCVALTRVCSVLQTLNMADTLSGVHGTARAATAPPRVAGAAHRLYTDKETTRQARPVTAAMVSALD